MEHRGVVRGWMQSRSRGGMQPDAEQGRVVLSQMRSGGSAGWWMVAPTTAACKFPLPSHVQQAERHQCSLQKGTTTLTLPRPCSWEVVVFHPYLPARTYLGPSQVSLWVWIPPVDNSCHMAFERGGREGKKNHLGVSRLKINIYKWYWTLFLELTQ